MKLLASCSRDLIPRLTRGITQRQVLVSVHPWLETPAPAAVGASAAWLTCSGLAMKIKPSIFYIDFHDLLKAD